VALATTKKLRDADFLKMSIEKVRNEENQIYYAIRFGPCRNTKRRHSLKGRDKINIFIAAFVVKW